MLELVEAAKGMNLVVAGDGPLRHQVPGARGFVRHDELQSLYARAAVVACPSRREGFGVACLEAMAHGRPVVATDVGGLRDLVVDGETGILVPARDPVALRAALERLLADPELRRRLGSAGRERARERFSWDAVTEATLAAYADAAGTMGRVKRALITGIGGQDGSLLAELLLEDDYAVAGLVRPGAGRLREPRADPGPDRARGGGPPP